MKTYLLSFVSKATLATLCMLAGIFPLCATATTWDLGSRLTLAEQYTDSVNASTTNGKQSALITEIRPGISADRRGSRIGVHADYQLQQFLYSINSVLPNEVRTYHQLSANADFEAIPDHLFLDALTSFSQTVIDPLQSAGLDNSTLSSNRNNILTYGARARWQNRLGEFGRAQATYNYTVTDRQSALLGDLIAQHFVGDASTGAWFQRFTGTSKLEVQKSENTIEHSKVGTLTGTLQAGYWLFPNELQAYARVIYLRNPQLSNKDPTRAEGLGRIVGATWLPNRRLTLGANVGKLPTGDSYEMSAQFRPSVRSSVAVGVGRTTFGKTYNGMLTSSGRYGSWSFSYREDLTTQSIVAAQQAWLAIIKSPDGSGDQVILARDRAVLDAQRARAAEQGYDYGELLIPQLVVDVPFVRARATASVSLVGRRNKVQVSLYREQQRYQELLPNNLLLGAKLNWDVSVSARSVVSAAASFENADYMGNTQSSNSRRGSLTFTNQLGRAVTGALSYGYNLRTTSNVADFEQSILRAQLAMVF